MAGGNIRTFLLQRHHLIDHLVRNAIEQRGVQQILEIACGLSPRGYRLRQQYPELNYVEADLPDMAARKHRLLSSQHSLNDQHRVVPVNIFSEEGIDSVENIVDKCLDRKSTRLNSSHVRISYA